MSGQENNSVEPLVEPLTRREREILALLAQGRTAPEIAQELILAVSSVKWYLQQLYGKLGVNSKQDAIARAGELGLLEPSPAAAPAPTTPPERKHNLPVQVTRFFGRENEIAQLKQQLTEHRLVTLTGSGGVGKTRLLLEAAGELVDNFSGGVWLVELAPLTDPALVPQQLAGVLGVRDEPGQPILEKLTYHLRDRRLLVLLDNCEHLLDACARLADTLLHTCPQVRLLASSREPLGVAGEAVFSIPSLRFPDPGQTVSLESLQEFAALQLFADRARLALPAYALAPGNVAAVARVCRRLDGIPLAIEMAAARINVLSAGQLADRLEDTFRVLSGGSRTALPRQQTLRATIDWSYKLLTDPERRLLQRLSVFAGGCTLEAVEAICADAARGEGLETSQAILLGEIVDHLAALVGKSMVNADRQPGNETRYRLLETVRQYAREKLEDNDDGARLRTCHRDYFLAFAETNVPRVHTAELPSWITRLQAERDNLRLALEWSFGDASNPEAAPRLLLAIFDVPGNSFPELLAWSNRAVAWCAEQPGISDSLHAHLLERAKAGDFQTGAAWIKQAVEISRRMGPAGKERLMWTLKGLASFIPNAGDRVEEAQAPFAEAEAIFQSLPPDRYAPDEHLRVRASFALDKSDMLNMLGRYADAQGSARESIRLYEESGSPWFGSLARLNLAYACVHLGEYEQARRHLLDALPLARSGSDVWELSITPYTLTLLAMIELSQGNLEQAFEVVRRGIRRSHEALNNEMVGRFLAIGAAIWVKQQQPGVAARLSGASHAVFLRLRRPTWNHYLLDSILPGWRDGPDQAAIQQAFDEGQAMNTDQAVAYALSDQDV